MQDAVRGQLGAITTAYEGLPSMNMSTTPKHPLATEAMMVDPQQSVSVQSPRSTHAVPSNSATAGQSRHAVEPQDQSFIQPSNPRQTNWGKLREQTRKDRSKNRVVLSAVNPDACFCYPILMKEIPDDSNERQI